MTEEELLEQQRLEEERLLQEQLNQQRIEEAKVRKAEADAARAEAQALQEQRKATDQVLVVDRSIPAPAKRSPVETNTNVTSTVDDTVVQIEDDGIIDDNDVVPTPDQAPTSDSVVKIEDDEIIDDNDVVPNQDLNTSDQTPTGDSVVAPTQGVVVEDYSVDADQFPTNEPSIDETTSQAVDGFEGIFADQVEGVGNQTDVDNIQNVIDQEREDSEGLFDIDTDVNEYGITEFESEDFELITAVDPDIPDMTSVGSVTVQNPNPEGVFGTAQELHSEIIKRGLVKSGESVGGGTAHAGSYAGVINAKRLFGDDFKYTAAVDDHYHHGLNYKSVHTTGLGHDISLKDGSKANYRNKSNQLEAYYKSLGLTVGRRFKANTDVIIVDEANRGSKASTGGHIHVEFTSKAAADKYFARQNAKEFNVVGSVATNKEGNRVIVNGQGYNVSKQSDARKQVRAQQDNAGTSLIMSGYRSNGTLTIENANPVALANRLGYKNIQGQLDANDRQYLYNQYALQLVKARKKELKGSGKKQQEKLAKQEVLKLMPDAYEALGMERPNHRQKPEGGSIFSNEYVKYTLDTAYDRSIGENKMSEIINDMSKRLVDGNPEYANTDGRTKQALVNNYKKKFYDGLGDIQDMTVADYMKTKVGAEVSRGSAEGSFAFGVDQLQSMLYRGAGVAADYIESDTLKEWAKEGVRAQVRDIAEGGYIPKYEGTISDTYEKDGFKAAAGHLAQSFIEGIPTGGLALAGSLATVASAPISVPLSLVIGGTTIGLTADMTVGDLAQELDDKEVYDPDDAGEILAFGALLGLVDVASGAVTTGAGKLVTNRLKKEFGEAGVKRAMLKTMTEEMKKNGSLAALGKVIKKQMTSQATAAKVARYSGKIGAKALGEGLTELAQEAGIVNIAESRGAKYEEDEKIKRYTHAFLVGTATGVPFSIAGNHLDKRFSSSNPNNNLSNKLSDNQATEVNEGVFVDDDGSVSVSEEVGQREVDLSDTTDDIVEPIVRQTESQDEVIKFSDEETANERAKTLNDENEDDNVSYEVEKTDDAIVINRVTSNLVYQTSRKPKTQKALGEYAFTDKAAAQTKVKELRSADKENNYRVAKRADGFTIEIKSVRASTPVLTAKGKPVSYTSENSAKSQAAKRSNNTGKTYNVEPVGNGKNKTYTLTENSEYAPLQQTEDVDGELHQYETSQKANGIKRQLAKANPSGKYRVQKNEGGLYEVQEAVEDQPTKEPITTANEGGQPYRFTTREEAEAEIPNITFDDDRGGEIVIVEDNGGFTLNRVIKPKTNTKTVQEILDGGDEADVTKVVTQLVNGSKNAVIENGNITITTADGAAKKVKARAKKKQDRVNKYFDNFVKGVATLITGGQAFNLPISYTGANDANSKRSVVFTQETVEALLERGGIVTNAKRTFLAIKRFGETKYYIRSDDQWIAGKNNAPSKTSDLVHINDGVVTEITQKKAKSINKGSSSSVSVTVKQGNLGEATTFDLTPDRDGGFGVSANDGILIEHLENAPRIIYDKPSGQFQMDIGWYNRFLKNNKTLAEGGNSQIGENGFTLIGFDVSFDVNTGELRVNGESLGTMSKNEPNYVKLPVPKADENQLEALLTNDGSVMTGEIIDREGVLIDLNNEMLLVDPNNNVFINRDGRWSKTTIDEVLVDKVDDQLADDLASADKIKQDAEALVDYISEADIDQHAVVDRQNGVVTITDDGGNTLTVETDPNLSEEAQKSQAKSIIVDMKISALKPISEVVTNTNTGDIWTGSQAQRNMIERIVGMLPAHIRNIINIEYNNPNNESKRLNAFGFFAPHTPRGAYIHIDASSNLNGYPVSRILQTISEEVAHFAQDMMSSPMMDKMYKIIWKHMGEQIFAEEQLHAYIIEQIGAVPDSWRNISPEIAHVLVNEYFAKQGTSIFGMRQEGIGAVEGTNVDRMFNEIRDSANEIILNNGLVIDADTMLENVYRPFLEQLISNASNRYQFDLTFTDQDNGTNMVIRRTRYGRYVEKIARPEDAQRMADLVHYRSISWFGESGTRMAARMSDFANKLWFRAKNLITPEVGHRIHGLLTSNESRKRSRINKVLRPIELSLRKVNTELIKAGMNVSIPADKSYVDAIRELGINASKELIAHAERLDEFKNDGANQIYKNSIELHNQYEETYQWAASLIPESDINRTAKLAYIRKHIDNEQSRLMQGYNHRRYFIHTERGQKRLKRMQKIVNDTGRSKGLADVDKIVADFLGRVGETNVSDIVDGTARADTTPISTIMDRLGINKGIGSVPPNFLANRRELEKQLNETYRRESMGALTHADAIVERQNLMYNFTLENKLDAHAGQKLKLVIETIEMESQLAALAEFVVMEMSQDGSRKISQNEWQNEVRKEMNAQINKVMGELKDFDFDIGTTANVDSLKKRKLDPSNPAHQKLMQFLGEIDDPIENIMHTLEQQWELSTILENGNELARWTTVHGITEIDPFAKPQLRLNESYFSGSLASLISFEYAESVQALDDTIRSAKATKDTIFDVTLKSIKANLTVYNVANMAANYTGNATLLVLNGTMFEIYNDPSLLGKFIDLTKGIIALNTGREFEISDEARQYLNEMIDNSVVGSGLSSFISEMTRGDASEIVLTKAVEELGSLFDGGVNADTRRAKMKHMMDIVRNLYGAGDDLPKALSYMINRNLGEKKAIAQAIRRGEVRSDGSLNTDAQASVKQQAIRYAVERTSRETVDFNKTPNMIKRLATDSIIFLPFANFIIHPIQFMRILMENFIMLHEDRSELADLRKLKKSGDWTSADQEYFIELKNRVITRGIGNSVVHGSSAVAALGLTGGVFSGGLSEALFRAFEDDDELPEDDKLQYLTHSQHKHMAQIMAHFTPDGYPITVPAQVGNKNSVFSTNLNRLDINKTFYQWLNQLDGDGVAGAAKDFALGMIGSFVNVSNDDLLSTLFQGVIQGKDKFGNGAGTVEERAEAFTSLMVPKTILDSVAFLRGKELYGAEVDRKAKAIRMATGLQIKEVQVRDLVKKMVNQYQQELTLADGDTNIEGGGYAKVMARNIEFGVPLSDAELVGYVEKIQNSRAKAHNTARSLYQHFEGYGLSREDMQGMIEKNKKTFNAIADDTPLGDDKLIKSVENKLKRGEWIKTSRNAKQRKTITENYERLLELLRSENTYDYDTY